MALRTLLPVLVSIATLSGADVRHWCASGADTTAAARREMWVQQATAGLDPRAIEALRQIPNVNRRLLAARAYLRADGTLVERWSWSQSQISAYPSTAQGKAAAADIEAVASVFAAEHPGFTLVVNRRPRSIELQLAHWNENESVGTAGAALAASLDREFPDNTTDVMTSALCAALIDWKPSVPMALAAPGLSAHGQGRAYDFQIEHNGRVVAGPDFASAAQQWDAAGWTRALHAAVSAAGNHFAGPLKAPYEPWHYAYIGTPATPVQAH